MDSAQDRDPGALDDLLDGLVAEYSDRVEAGDHPSHREFLRRAEPSARPGLERCLKIIDAGNEPVGRAMVGPGERLGRFKIQRELGRGGMAVVYLADDPELRRAVALKVLRPGLALDESHVDRFVREGRAMARLNHPGVVQVFEVGRTGSVHWIAMEYVPGPSLKTVIDGLHAGGHGTAEGLGRMVQDPSLAEFASLEAACAQFLKGPTEGLVAAHDAGLIHRDIKPSNILVHAGGRAVLADFGLARADGDPGMSLTGEPIGTPHYMAPEQAEAASRSVDARADVYGMGVVLFELISGMRPFDGTTVLEVLDAIRFEIPKTLRAVAPSASANADAMVALATSRDPEKRYATAEAFLGELDRLSVGETTEARATLGGPMRRFFAGVGAVFSSRSSEYRSAATFLGIPLLHVVGAPVHRGPGALLRRPKTAVGWIALGPRAIGGVAIGGLSLGVLSSGGLAAGLIAGGGLSAGGLTAGGLSVGVRAFGGLAIGDVALGGLAVGRGAIGGMAIGRYTLSGGDSIGPYAAYAHLPERSDPEVYGFFQSEPAPLRDIYLGIFGEEFAEAAARADEPK